MLCANLSISNSRFWFICCKRCDVAAGREGANAVSVLGVGVKELRVSSAESCIGSDRRAQSIVEGSSGGGSLRMGSGGGWRSESQVWRSERRLR